MPQRTSRRSPSGRYVTWQARAILFNCHHFNTRRTKQDLVRLLDSLFFRVRETEQGAVHLHHRRLVFDLWLKDDDFFLDSDCSQPV